MASSSTHNQHHDLYNATAAPPPTPLSNPNTHLPSSSSSAAADELSRLLLRLPPALSLPTPRRSLTQTPATISLSDHEVDDRLLSAASQHGFFQLINHTIVSPQLADSVELAARSLFELSSEQKSYCFPKNWPLGFDDDEEGSGTGGSFWLDSECSTESTQELDINLGSLRELTRGMEKAGLEIVEILSRGLGFDNPFKDDPTRWSSFMVVSDGCCNGDKPVMSGGSYPYVVGLHYRIGFKKCSLLSDSGWVPVQPETDSILVTIGDIAQVWSNGEVKKVRGRPVAMLENGSDDSVSYKTLSLLLTLPLETTVSPLIKRSDVNGNEDGEGNDGKVFGSFSLEEYAWRIYHEPLLFKDPLERFRI